jgi:hypothetical protein
MVNLAALYQGDELVRAQTAEKEYEKVCKQRQRSMLGCYAMVDRTRMPT